MDDRLKLAVAELTELVLPARVGAQMDQATHRQKSLMRALAPNALAIFDEVNPPQAQPERRLHDQGRRDDVHNQTGWPEPGPDRWLRKGNPEVPPNDQRNRDPKVHA
jgi:hypothetical protein